MAKPKTWDHTHCGVSEGRLQEFRQVGARFELMRERAGVLRIQLSGLKEPGLVGVWRSAEGGDAVFLADSPDQLKAWRSWRAGC